MQSFYYDLDSRDIPLTNPTLITILTTAVGVIGYRAWFVEKFQDNLLFLMFIIALLAFWRCLTVLRVDEVRRDGTSIIKIRLQGFLVLILLLILSVARLSLVLIFFLLQSEDDENLFKKLSQVRFLIDGGRTSVHRTIDDVKWAIADLVILLLITIIKNKLTLTFTSKYQMYLRSYYKRLNYLFTMISYPFLGFEALSNPLYIFIIYLVLRNQINSAGQETWASTNSLIGVLRYIILIMIVLSSVTAQSIYKWLGADEHKLTEDLHNGFYMDILFFLTCHLCVYFGTLYRSIPKKEEDSMRNCVYPNTTDKETYFENYFLSNWMRIITSSHFVYTANYFSTYISTVRKAFEPDSLINDHILKMKIKQETHKYKWLKRLSIKVVFSNI